MPAISANVAEAGLTAGGRIKTGAGIKACRLAGMLAFALVLAGCDSCGDWISPMGGSQACRQQAPRPQ